MEDQDPNELSNDGKETYKDNTNEEFMIGKIFSILGLFKFYRTRVHPLDNFESSVRRNGKLASIIYMKKFNKSNNQYYMFCMHEGSYKSQKKTENEKISSTVKKGCKAQIYGRFEKNS